MTPGLGSRSSVAAMLAGAAFALGACGGDDAEVGPDPAGLTPGDALVFAAAVVRPEGDLHDQVDEGLARLLATDQPGSFVVEQLDRALADSDAGITYAEDLEPWLGQTAGLFLTDVGADGAASGAVLVSVTDAHAAEATIDELIAQGGDPGEERAYGDVAYRASEDGDAVGIVDDFLVFGDEPSFERAVDASRGAALASNPDYTDAIDLADSQPLLTLYAQPGGALDLLAGSGEISRGDAEGTRELLGAAADGPIVAWGALDADRLSLAGAASASEGPPPGEGAVLGELPGDAWLAFGAGNAGSSLQGAMSGAALGGGDGAAAIERELGIDLERDLASWLGNAAGFVSGSSVLGIGGGLLAETTDEAASAEALDRLGAVLERSGEVDVEPAATGAGFTITIPGAPVGAEVVQDGDRVVAAGGAVSVEDVLDPGEGTLDDSEEFQAAREALGEDLQVGLYVSLDELFGLVDGIPGAGDDPDYREAKAYLDHLAYLIAGSRRDGERDLAGIVLGLQEGPEDGGAAAAVVSP
jgi:hypothetical protein